MRIWLLLLATFSIHCATAPQKLEQPSMEQVKAELHERSRALVQAEIERNVDVVNYFSPDVVFYNGSSPAVVGRDELRALYVAGWESTDTKSFDSEPVETVIAESGEIAYERGWNRGVYNTESGEFVSSSDYLLIWERVEGDWLVTVISVTRNP